MLHGNMSIYGRESMNRSMFFTRCSLQDIFFFFNLQRRVTIFYSVVEPAIT
jgi:hypothetical protein